MLKFNPANQLHFTPNADSRLQTSFIISNPTNKWSAPFKIKSSKPELFIVRPYIGVILPLQQVQITITTKQSNSHEFAKEIAHEHKFKVEYSMLETAPFNITDAIKKITDQNKQIHKLYICTPSASKGPRKEDYIDSKSNLSNRYKTVKDENEDIGLNRYSLQPGNYSDMSHEQRLDFLKEQIDKLQKERSQIIMASKPKKRLNLLTIILILIFFIVVGNLSSKMIGIKSPSVQPKGKQREYRYFGLQKLWAEEQLPPKAEQPWWKWWN